MNYIDTANELLEKGAAAQIAFFAQIDESFLDQMVEHIGSADVEVRDHTNLRLLLESNAYNALLEAQKHYLLRKIVDNKLLLHELSKNDAESVFTRSLAAEWLRVLLEGNVRLLDSELMEPLLLQAVTLLERERDLRAYTSTGLAYSVVNVANLIKLLIAHPEFNVKYSPRILFALQSNFWKNHVFIDNEEEAFLDVVQKLISGYIEEEIVIEWVEQIFDKLNTIQAIEGYSELFLHGRTNVLIFMKSFYFVLKFNNGSKKLQAIISQSINDWHRI